MRCPARGVARRWIHTFTWCLVLVLAFARKPRWIQTRISSIRIAVSLILSLALLSPANLHWMKYSISRHTQFQFPKIRHRGFISMETVSFDDSSLSHAICFSVRFPRASVNVIRPLLSNRSSPSSPHAYTVIYRLIRQYQSLNLIEETYFQCCTMYFDAHLTHFSVVPYLPIYVPQHEVEYL